MDEQRAIARLRQGDITGLEPLVRTYQLQAVRTAYLIVRDRALAEDLVQAAFLRVYERIGSFDPRRPFGPWFVRSVLHDALKAAQRRERQVSLDAPTDGAATFFAEVLAAATPAPELLAEQTELRQAIWQALGRLSAEQRTAIVQRYYLEMSEAEMSAQQHCPPGTIKWRLHQARQRLAVLLRPWRAGERSADEAGPVPYSTEQEV